MSHSKNEARICMGPDGHDPCDDAILPLPRRVRHAAIRNAVGRWSWGSAACRAPWRSVEHLAPLWASVSTDTATT